MTATYLLIEEDGTAVWGEQPPTLDLVDEKVGQHGRANVWLDRNWHAHGWVSDCGLIMPEHYQRNPVGSCVLACLGANKQPYAGQVLITGYDHSDDWGGPEPLDAELTKPLRTIVREVGRALAGEIGGQMPAIWYHETRSFAELVRTGDIPPITWGTL